MFPSDRAVKQLKADFAVLFVRYIDGKVGLHCFFLRADRELIAFHTAVDMLEKSLPCFILIFGAVHFCLAFDSDVGIVPWYKVDAAVGKLNIQSRKIGVFELEYMLNLERVPEIQIQVCFFHFFTAVSIHSNSLEPIEGFGSFFFSL